MGGLTVDGPWCAVDVLARLHLAARRRGLELRINAPPELRELIAFCGLEDVLR